MDIQLKMENFIDQILKEEEKCLKTLEDPWIFIDDESIETSNSNIQLIDFADEFSNIYRGILMIPNEKEFILFFNEGNNNKCCKISQKRAIEYLILTQCHEIIAEWNLWDETLELIENNEELMGIFNGEYEGL